MVQPSEFPLPQCLADVRIESLPRTAYYIADFISKEEEGRILDKIAQAPKPRWKQLSHRRLQAWPSELVKDTTLLAAPLPPWLEEPIINRLLSLTIDRESGDHIFTNSPHGRPNHVLINEYNPGAGIMPHKDGAAYYPVVCTVSLGASLCLDIYQSREDGVLEREPIGRIVQEPRSLLITTDYLYCDYLHGIADTTEDVGLSRETAANWTQLRSPTSFTDGRNKRATRTSLTYRDVIKTAKLGQRLGMLGKAH